MKTNARKILSLLLSFLMVFGSVATLLPTTVMAAETNATTDGTAIDCVIKTAADIYADGGVTSLIDNATSNSTIQAGKVEFKGLVDGMARFGVKSANAGQTSTTNDRMLIDVEDVVFSEYPYLVMVYKTNIEAANLNFNMTTKGAVESGDHKKFASQTRTSGELAMGVAQYTTFKSSFAENGFVTGIYVPIWSNTSATMAADDYFDVQYVGFFKSQEDFEKFDFVEYNKVTVTVNTAEGPVTVKAVPGETVDLLDEINLPYTNKDGGFLVLEDENGNLNSVKYLVTDDAVLIAKYVPVSAVIDADYVKNAGKTTWINGANLFTGSTIETIDGDEYITMTIGTQGSSHNFVVMYPEVISAASSKYVVVDAIKNIDSNKIFVRFNKNNVAKEYDTNQSWRNNTYSSIAFDGTDYVGKHVFELPAAYSYSDVYGINIAPWQGSSTAAGSYFKLRYVASFETADAAVAFDYDAYKYSLENDLYVTLKKPTGEVISSTYVAKGGEFTFPDYTSDVVGSVFGGWKAADGTMYQADSKITVSESLTFTAVVAEPVEVKLLDTNGDELVTKNIIPGVTVDLSTIAGIPYKNADGDFLVWTDGTNLYSDTYEVTNGVTLTAQYEAIRSLITPEYINGASRSDSFNLSYELVTVDGESRFRGTSTGSNGHRFILPLPTGVLGSDIGVFVVNYVTDKSNQSFIQFVVGSSRLGQTFVACGPQGEDGLYYTNAVYSTDALISAGHSASTVTAVRWAPWQGDSVGNSWHFDVRYMAMFDSEAASIAFDYGKYTSYTITLKDENGEVDEVISVKGGDKYTLPGGYTQIGANITKIGWIDENGNSYAGEITVTGDLVLTPANVTATALVYAAGNGTLDVFVRDNGKFNISGKLSENGVDFIRATPGTAATSVAKSQLAFNFAAQNATYDPYDHMVWYYRTNIADANSKHTLSYSGTSAQEGAYDDGTGWSNNDSLKAKYPIASTGAWTKKVLNPAHKDIVTTNTNFMGMRFNPWGADYAWTADQYFDISYIAFLPDEDFALAFDIDAYLDSLKTEVTVYGYGSEEPVVVKINAGSTIPVDKIATQYVEDGQLMVISGWEIDGATYPVDTYLVNSAVTATAVYAPAYILAEADGTLVGSSRDTATVNNPVAFEEDGVYFERYTANAGTTIDQSQAQFEDTSKTKLYSEVPYVAYSYRTNITPPNGYWYTAYTVKGWGSVPMEDNPDTATVETAYYGTAVFQQKVNGIVSDGEWHVAVHKPEKFGDYPNEDRYADASMYLTHSRLAPWQTQANVAITGDEYLDVEYIGFFPSAVAANNFDFDAYLADLPKNEYTIELTASVGGQVEYNGVTATSHTINAYEGQVLTFTAVPSVEYNTKLRNWHDLTSGQIVVLTDKNGIPYEDDNAPTTIDYTVKGNAVINANFVHISLSAPVKLVAFIGRGNQGYITVGGGDTPSTYFSEYMNGNNATELTAVAYDGYTPAYWVRFTQDSLTQVLLATGDTLEAYPLGGSVYYQPVFAEVGTPVDIYINKATREIIPAYEVENYDAVKNETLSTDVVTVYDCTKSVVADDENLLEVYDKNGNIVKEAKNPAFASEWIISTVNDGMKWTMSINDGEAFDVSYDKEFRFNYMFTDKTKVVITETAIDGTENTDYVIETLATWSANGITNFTGIFDLAEGLTLVQHGVMMSQDADELNALANNETGIIEVADGTIVGKVNATVTTSLYTVSKRLADANDDWYGRAYLIYKNGETTYLVYAEDTIPVPAV